MESPSSAGENLVVPPARPLSQLEFQRSLLQARLAMELGATTGTSSDKELTIEPMLVAEEESLSTPEASLVSDADLGSNASVTEKQELEPEQSSSEQPESVSSSGNVKQSNASKEQTPLHESYEFTTSEVPLSQDQLAVDYSIPANSFKFQQALLKARLEMESRKSMMGVPDQLESEEVLSLSETLDMVAEDVKETVVETAAPKPTKIKEPSYWQSLSGEDVQAIIVKSVTPERSLHELREASDDDLLGYTASRLSTSLFEVFKCLLYSAKAATGGKTEEIALASASEAIQKVVSAFVAMTVLGLRATERAQEYALQLPAERIENERKAAESRKVEEERRMVEAERLAAERKLEEEARLAEELALEEIRIKAEEAKTKVETLRALAEKEAIDEIRRETEIKKKLMGDMTDDVPIFFADEL